MPIASGLDFGTTTISAVAIDEHGMMLACATTPNDARVDGLPAGFAEQSPNRLFEIANESLHAVSSQLGARVAEVCTLGVTGQMHGILLVDDAGIPLSNLINWQDKRVLQSEGDVRVFDALVADVSNADQSPTGCRLSPGYGAITLAAVVRSGKLPQNFSRCCTVMDWFASRIVDVEIPKSQQLPIVTDRSNAASLGIFNFETDTWDPGLLRKLNLDETWLPEVRDSGSVAGELAMEFAANAGLPAGVSVCVPIGDHQAAVLGSGGGKPGGLHVNLGTGGQISWATDHFHRQQQLDTRYLPGNQFMFVGAGQVGGNAYAWVAETAQSWLKDFGFDVPLDAIYQKMNATIDDEPDKRDQLVCEPFFHGTRLHPDIRGSFGNVSGANFRLPNIAEAVVDGIVTALFQFYSNASGARKPQRIIATGNAIRRIPRLPQKLADVFQTDVYSPQHDEQAAFGTAMLAGCTKGLWESIEQASQIIQFEHFASPG